ncbi:16S rRNA (adenine(1518)-N(6)/adenine(1519)-N(6))-dimethyltransferase RsmA [Chlamydia sp.]|uniref:16S rRNA (adenine(1518)-N(6)/adenine(1519)-N(6))- dimethyltransferase RsmA n=1 Tax=Chlamydia sp. TaxID=35827 RepID=UPI0025C493E4|nr:16S rRNA (adenine(1518)-N(6)/adenine(1519)-N(6))-dimethyltransferase RsmA [Chlamydia sp.]MBQ8498242.1 16S rRNA (adenine(1518)-N(6)/adenine(1519)-N(6))-dimethyltransferase RsmA [Chlamydia sp.]
MARSSIEQLTSFLKSVNGRAKKALSQNFLVDGNILKKILMTAEVQPGDWVLEVGPGFGALSEVLVSQGANVIALEKDPMFKESLSELPIDVEIVDACKYPLASLDDKGWRGRGRVVANLPYHVTTPLLTKFFLESPHRWKTVTVMIQDEVAQRITAKPGDKDYSSLTVFLRFFADVRYAFKVSPNCFYPKPSVHSAVVHMCVHDKFALPSPEREEFFTLTRAAFGQRRKLLANSLKDLYPKDKIFEVLEQLGFSEKTRPENISFEEYLKIFRLLKDF